MLELVGVGGMGRVYRAEQKALGRTVAVKVIHPHLVHDENASARFITEARAASALNHPNSVSIIDFGKTDDGLLYLVMEFLRGKDLARVIYDEGPLGFPRIVNVLKQVLAALAEAHHLGIIHRDLKPENIILERLRSGSDFVKVVDFGLAKVRAMQSSSITSPGIVCGTPDYMAPEQGRGDAIDARSDLYAVGVIMFRLLAGRLPFEGESATQVVLKHITLPPPDPRTIAPERGIPPALVDVVLKALSKHPNDRYPDADAFADALDAALNDAAPETLPRGGATSCPSCGSTLPRAQKFCGDCGAPLQGARTITSPTRATDADVARPSGNRGARLPLPLTGRDFDLAWLEEQRARVHKAPVLGCIIGEPGVGKTRLLKEFLTSASREGDRIIEVGPDPWWADVGYFALRNAVRALADLPEDGGRERDWVGASQEARRGLIEIFDRTDGSSSAISAAERRYTAAEALRWAMTRAASNHARGVILAIDDAHLVDGASRNAFADALAEPPLVPILVLATASPRGELEWPEQAAICRLSGLTSAAAMQLARGLPVGSSPIEGAPGGVMPLYVEQLVRLSAEGGGEAPPRLADLIAMRIERLAPFARRLLHGLSVLGNDVEADVLHLFILEASQKSGLLVDTDLGMAIEQLISAGMVEFGSQGLRHTHPLIREVASATIPAAVRREMHAEAARLAQSKELPLEVRAMHQFHAEDAFEALCLMEQVADRALARADLKGAVHLLRQGLDLARREIIRGELDDPMRAVLIFSRKLGEALTQAGSLSGAQGVLLEALDLVSPSGQERAQLLSALAMVAHGRERPREAFEYLEEALDHAARSGARELVASLENLRQEWMTWERAGS